MKKLMKLDDKLLSRKKSIVENVYDQLRNIPQIAHSHHGYNQATKEKTEELLMLAIEGQKRIKDQLLRIDSTYPKNYV